MKTMAQKVREAFNEIGRDQDEITATQLVEHLGLSTSKQKPSVYCTLTDMKSRGEIVSVSRGVYRYKTVKKKPFVRTVMWRILRSRKKVKVEDLIELAGASEPYAVEWLRMLKKRNIVKKMKGGSYRLVNDVVNEPVSLERAERLKNWRKRKKAAMAALDRASAAIDDARKILKKD